MVGGQDRRGPGALNTSLGTGESRPGLLHLDRPTGGLWWSADESP